MLWVVRRVVAVTLALGCFMTLPAWANRYRIVDLGAGDSAPYRINDSGTIAGTDPDGRAAIYQDGAWHPLSNIQSSANAVNDRGQVAGWDVGYGVEAVVWQRDGTKTMIPIPKHGARGNAQGISSTGIVTGYYNTDEQVDGFHCFLWTPLGRSIDLDRAHHPYCVANAINKFGEVVGESSSYEGAYPNAFVWRAGRMHDLGVPGIYSSANDINASGDAVGFSVTGNQYDPLHAMLWHDGKTTDLNADTSNFFYSYAKAINDKGEIIGTADMVSEGNRSEVVRFDHGKIVRLADEVENLGTWYLWTVYDVNAKGEIIGWGNAHDSERHSFLLVPID